uniref:Uncharacterized protein n=1 Tax=Arundo donax TaxID=35708 RepID=A0A0A8Z5X0_ARUDO
MVSNIVNYNNMQDIL